MTLCPCCSSEPYATCCQPYHDGGEPDDAVSLMRSRYSAFAKGHAKYLWRTLHPSHEDRQNEKATILAAYKQTAEQTVYKSLSILDSTSEDEKGVHTVLFRAEMHTNGRDVSFVELSGFLRTKKGRVGLRYHSGITADSTSLPTALDIPTFIELYKEHAQKAQQS